LRTTRSRAAWKLGRFHAAPIRSRRGPRSSTISPLPERRAIHVLRGGRDLPTGRHLRLALRPPYRGVVSGTGLQAAVVAEVADVVPKLPAPRTSAVALDVRGTHRDAGRAVDSR